MKYNTNPLVFLTWYQSHCSNPLVCRSLAVLSSWVPSAVVVVSSTTAPTVTSVHQRPLPCRHHRFRFSNQTTDYIIGTYSLRSAFLWIFVFIGPSTRHQNSRRHWHAPSRADTMLHALSRACTRQWPSADVSPRWRHLPRHLLMSSTTHLLTSALTVDFDRWLFAIVDFCSPGAPYPIFRVDFIFAVYFCIFCF